MAHHSDPAYPPLMLDQAAALRAYACRHGRSWKTKLWAEWMDATAEPLLHHLRNSHGPVWLDHLVLKQLDRISRTPFASLPATPGS